MSSGAANGAAVAGAASPMEAQLNDVLAAAQTGESACVARLTDLIATTRSEIYISSYIHVP